ncbi:hypothetical protein ACFO0N_14035 [Halobium salinum]|uniref:DUF7835 domain-containing protein n=1 Tax=Halobium salinum TaxID=1364940 RepID=A0ABD5PEI8_9EURY|nr:hypothetical protein [Halobium salinum]
MRTKGSHRGTRADENVEHCEHCGRDTRHRVSIELVSHSDRGSNARFAREPHRVANCRDCGTERTVRLNHDRSGR